MTGVQTCALPILFFVGKKDGKKRMVQDYRYLNEWTIKNNYPLPLISDVIENIGMKKVFTKMDLRWGYNNIWIKEGDKWKVAFTTPEGSFEPRVMFFGLTNSPATFQAMMNELLRDLINIGKVAAFIDDVIIGTESDEGHDELVAEVIKRLEENDLYVKFTHGRLSFSILLFIFIFISVLFFYFSIFRTTRVRVYRSHCHISHNLMM